MNKFLNNLYPGATDDMKIKFHNKRAQLLSETELVVVDVGAAAGLMPHWEKFKHFATIFAIEPDERSSANLKKIYSNFPNYHVVEKAISDKTENKTLYLTNVPTGSSLLEPNLDYLYLQKNDSYFSPFTTKSIPTYSFIDIIKNDIKKDINALKIDIQGYEYYVLKNLLSENTTALLCAEFEVGMPGAYLNQPQYRDVDILLSENEFEVYDIRVARAYFPRNRLKTDLSDKKIISNSPKISSKIHELDVVYFKKLSTVLKTKDKNLILKMMMLLNSYNFFYEATYLVEQAYIETIFSREECEDLINFVWDWYKVLEEEPLYADTEGSNVLRTFISQFNLKNSPTWHRYMQQQYPN
jgi:FkbM family methyltransferase